MSLGMSSSKISNSCITVKTGEINSNTIFNPIHPKLSFQCYQYQNIIGILHSLISYQSQQKSIFKAQCPSRWPHWKPTELEKQVCSLPPPRWLNSAGPATLVCAWFCEVRTAGHMIWGWDQGSLLATTGLPAAALGLCCPQYGRGQKRSTWQSSPSGQKRQGTPLWEKGTQANSKYVNCIL